MNLSVVVLASGALLLAGCGGTSSSSGVAHLSSSTSGHSSSSGGGSSSPESSASAQQKMVAYAQCMRTHGVPEFPEPTEGKLLFHSSDKNGHVTGLNPGLRSSRRRRRCAESWRQTEVRLQAQQNKPRCRKAS